MYPYNIVIRFVVLLGLTFFYFVCLAEIFILVRGAGFNSMGLLSASTSFYTRLG